MPEKQQLECVCESITLVHTEMVFLFPGNNRNFSLIRMDRSLFLSNSFRSGSMVLGCIMDWTLCSLGRQDEFELSRNVLF